MVKNEFTECYVYTNSKEGAAKGNIAVAKIHFGKSGILLLLSKTTDGVAWRPPYLNLQQNGHASPMAAFAGEMLAEAKYVAEKAVEKIKTTFGKTEFGKSYRVAKGVCEVVANPE